MALTYVNEGSTAYLTVTFHDREDNVAAMTGTLRYKILCVTTGTEVLAETNVAVSSESSKELTLTSAINTLVNQSHTRERRRISLWLEYGISEEIHMTHDYWIVNMPSA